MTAFGRALLAILCCVIASTCAQMFTGEPDLPAECVWTGDMCATVATGPDAALYHQVTDNFEACFSSTVVAGQYVHRYSGCDEVPAKATCASFFSVPLQLCLPDKANWTSVTDLQSVLRLLIECQDAAVVSSRQCEKFRADLYIGLQCEQCVAPANAVAAASVVCGQLTTASQCIPDAAGGADFQGSSDIPLAAGPDDLVLAPGGADEDAPRAVELPGGGFDGAFPAGVPVVALVPDGADDLDLLNALEDANPDRALSDPGGPDSGQAPAPEVSEAHSTLEALTVAAGILLVAISLL